MKNVNLKCDSCGAVMHLNENKNIAICPYCNNKKLIEKKEDINTLKKQAAELSYVKEAGRQRAIAEAESKRKRNKAKKIFKVVLIISCIIGLSFFVNHMTKAKIEDPFKCVNISFSGIDGEGKISIINNESCSEYNDIDFIASKETEINEGEKIKVRAVSELYRFGLSTKEFNVEGLSKYLTNLDSLSNDLIEKIHEFSYNELKNGSAFGITFTGEIVSLKPYKMYLYTNGTNENILYDVYTTSIRTSSGKTFDKYVVAYYEDFLLIKNKTDFSYERLYHCGNVISAGDPNVHTANSKDYEGNIIGFLTIEDFNIYLNKSNDGSYFITER
jgi:DNA-directed RNA polymerase subunit RPC12/RpoP